MRIGVALLAGALVAAAAALAPGALIAGSPATGPHGLHGYRSGALAHELRVRWSHRRTAIDLAVRTAGRCPPVVRSTGSLAPGHVQVRLSRSSDRRCGTGPQRWWEFALPLPAVAQPGRAVDVVVDDVHLRLGA